ncbi:high mobility group protein Z [Lucilia cuprina]|uniref:high mobility group protein Z n=1 Tax=Lucilia cuprina TaxID=7375 RepID=UPI000C71A03B|nr:high mobility group protein Z [Lucilia cuprina]XP_023297778.1 high mobility group protein Z [Lucilia cuprina]XP_023297779.1 high mobility group protein Z [Lucilia cuprina]XP_037821910.1 high mobility group protein Z [Lucilia sericata]XP_037821911.1 high mobility group protein Z [Lucilia sericata]XP_037821912.1 high mobility group protein Z [Lucilia sericata]KAI8122609.1 High mobility group protein Z [Lucilia cuprina]KAI8122610.1 High mobility group protein Z [Lucilia cuprina]
MAGERPKRPLSAYMLWLNENREQLKKENPGSKVTEIAKRGGELWRAIKDKTEWEQKAIKMKEEYNKAVKEYEANGGTDTGAGKKRKSKATKPVKKAKKKETSEEEEEEESD